MKVILNPTLSVDEKIDYLESLLESAYNCGNNSMVEMLEHKLDNMYRADPVLASAAHFA